MKQSTKVSLGVVIVICVFLLINGAIVLYACIVWPQENAGSPLFITGVVTFLISFSLPFVLVGAFLLYSLCQQECSPRIPTRLDLLPAEIFRSANSGSNNSITGMLQNDNCPYTLLEVGRPDVSWSTKDADVGRSREADDVNKVSSKYFTPFNHRMMQSSFDLCQEEASVGHEKDQEEEQELQELHFTRSISPSPLPPARFIRMAGKELILGPQ